MPVSPAAPQQPQASPLSRGRRILIIMVSSVLAVTLVMTLLVYFMGNSAANLRAMSVPEVNALTAEQIEGLEGLIEISDITLRDSEGKVFEEDAREGLLAEQAVAREFLAELPTADDAVSKQQAVERYDRVEERFAELFEAIRLVQKDVKQWEDAH